MYLAVPGGLATYHALRPSYVAAYCKQKYPGGIQRLTPPTHLHLHDNQHPFNWSLFAKFILPDLILLLVAVGVSSFPYSLHQFGLTSHPYPPILQSAVVAALLNISIPLELGQLINSVANLEPGHEVRHYLSQLTPGAARLLALYILQVRTLLTWWNIINLVGLVLQ